MDVITSSKSGACLIAFLKSRKNLVHTAVESNFSSWCHGHSEESNRTVLKCNREYGKNSIKKFLNLYVSELKQALCEVTSSTQIQESLDDVLEDHRNTTWFQYLLTCEAILLPRCLTVCRYVY